MDNNQEANILSYRILFDTSGKLVREDPSANRARNRGRK